jgi:hypothetical protein
MTGRDIERTVREVANSEGHWVSPADRDDDGDFGDPRYWNRKGGPREEADMAVSLAILLTVIAKVWL